MTSPRLITRQREWNRLATSLASEQELAIDTESNSRYSYRGRICLIQIGTAGSAHLIDPLALSDLSALGSILAEPSITKVVHGSDYDLRCFYREYGFEVKSLFDTEISSRFLGVPASNLGSVLRNFLGVEIPKSLKLQKSDWGKRPLSKQAIDYAVADIHHLLPLAAELRNRLTEVGRLDWIQEECNLLEQNARARVEHTERSFLKMRGAGRLSMRQLAVLKELFEFREKEAERRDWPPYWVIPNDVLLFIAKSPSTPLSQVPNLSSKLINRVGQQIEAAVQCGQCGPEVQRPPLSRKTRFQDPDVESRLQVLNQWRRDKGATLGLDPALLWPTPSLERLARNPHQQDTELSPAGSPEIRYWQRQQFAAELAAAVQDAARRFPLQTIPT